MLDYSLLYPMTTPTRCSMKLDGMWKFSLDWQGEGEKLGWSKGVPGRDMIPVPASFQDFYTEKAIREYTGDMWYETDITIPVFMRGSDVFIRFGAATHRAWVYLNGELVGEHEGGFLPFLVDITDKAVYGELNRLVVRVNNELNETNIPCGRTIRLENGRKMSKPYFDFYNYSGLQRSVHLIAVPKNSITDVDLSYEIGEGEARINYSVSQKGKGDVSLKLYDEDGKLVSEAFGASGYMCVENPHLWRVRDAYLYTLEITLSNGNEVLDMYPLEIGIRTVEIKGTEILLNGSPIYLKGFGKHEDSDIVGRGFNIGVMKRDFELMKWIGASRAWIQYRGDETRFRAHEMDRGKLIQDFALSL